MPVLSFKTSKEDFDTIVKIRDRAVAMFEAHGDYVTADESRSLLMDLTACHANGNPLRLDDLLAADDFNLAHDVGGIRRHINRTTGKLENCFVPRFSRRD